MISVAASLWSVPAGAQLETALRLRDAGVNRLHWDTTDGRFAAAGGFTPERAAAISDASGLAAEVHVMAERSPRDFDAWTEFCDLVIVHVESRDWQQAVDRVSRRGGTPGVAISPGTPASAIPADLTALCMAIVPGTAGSAFDSGVLKTVRSLRDVAPERRIGIDGGVRRQFVEDVESAGADWVVVGNDLVFGGEERWSDLLVPER